MGLHTAAVRRLTGDEHLGSEFATTWPEYDLDAKTRAMLAYGSKLTEAPSMVDGDDTAKLKEAGWSDVAVWQITALASFFNFSGRMEAASGLPPDVIPAGAKIAEAKGA
ncbi:MAG TPA: hypothetical protein VKU85_09110 [bacterium]|nr:hypothetical protein [bacterium]